MANKALTTLLTFVGGFHSMDFLVLNKVFVVAEGLLAFSTAVGLFCGVNGQVSI